jgi:hypothetical protein
MLTSFDGLAAVAGDGLRGRVAQATDALVPKAVAKPRREPPGRIQSRDQKRGEHAVLADGGAPTGEKLLDLIDHTIDVAGPDRMIASRKLDETRTGDLLSEVASARDLHPAIVAAMKHQGRRANVGKRVAHVDLRIHAGERDGRGWADRQAFEARPPRLETRILGPAGRKTAQRGAAPPGALGLPDEGRERLVCGATELGVAAVEHERARARRMRRREQDRYRGTLGCSEQGGATAAGGIHHRPHVVHAGLRARRIAGIEPVAQAGPASVEQDQSRECCEPVQEMAVAWIFPVDLQV